MMGVKVIFSDLGIESLTKKFAAIDGMKVTPGFQGPSARDKGDSDVSVATRAQLNEFGTEKIPQRSFMRSTMFEKRADIVKSFGIEFHSLFGLGGFSTPITALAGVGEKIAQMMTRKIDTSYSWAKQNAGSTIRRKGFNYPLHDTDQMANSVTYAVRSPEGNIQRLGGPRG